MTDTEKILNLLEINERIACAVVDERNLIISSNNSWAKIFGTNEIGKDFKSIFDNNTRLLVENSLIDVNTFNKVQRRNVSINIGDKAIDFRLLMSPFTLNSKSFIYIVLYNNVNYEDIFIYPSSDDKNVSIKYGNIINQFGKSSSTLVNNKNIQYELDINKTALAIKDKENFLFANYGFKELISPDVDKLSFPLQENYLHKGILEFVKFAERQIPFILNLFVIEETNFVISGTPEGGRIIILPLDNKELDKFLFIGRLNREEGLFASKLSESDSSSDEIQNEDLQINISELNEPYIIYNKNDFDILDANQAAADLYRYELNDFKNMNITRLFWPEDMQKILMPADDNGKFLFQQICKDGSIIEVTVEREDISWKGQEACLEKILSNLPEEEVIELEEYNYNSSNSNSVSHKIKEEIKGDLREDTSEFLSSLFHELLTPVNVILGFVQEIIDSIDNPSEEQEESAKIIKDNQQILLHTMNTAVQFAQLESNKIKLTVEKFDINNHLVDLQDSFSRVAERENSNVIFEDIPDSLIINHDRSKLLASISFFIKFAVKLTDSSKLFLSIKQIEDQFYLILRDSDKEISQSVFKNLNEIFNSPILSTKKNYGISHISIRLARRLNKLLSVTIKEYIDSNGNKFLALTTPLSFDEKLPISKPVHVEEDGKSDEPLNKASETIIENPDIYEIPVEDITTDEIHESENLKNGEVDNKIIEDIADDEEIITEEIATLMHNNNQINLSDLSCLFIDDSVDTQLLFKSQMKDFKFLKICSNLTEAIPSLNKYNFDLIIVDVNLNDTYNGLDALKIIRQFDNYKSTPVIAVTAYSFEGDRKKFINFGFTDYLAKPIFREQLVKSLEVIIP